MSPSPGFSGFSRSRMVLDALVGVSVCTAHQCLALSITFGTTLAENDT